MTTIVEPLFDRVLIRRIEAETKSKGGILIPETAKDKPLEGKVIAIGPDVVKIKVGDRVLIGKYAGIEIKLNEIEHLIIRLDEILGIIR